MPSRFAPRRIAVVGLGLTVAAVQYSIAVSELFFAFSLAAWAVTLVTERRRPSAPPWIVPLMLYAGWTLASTAFSPDVVASLRECKQLVLLLLVPLTYEIVEEDSALMLTAIILVAGVVSAVIAIGQYSILHHDLLTERVRGTLGHYMTFSGLMMLVLNVALARALFITRSRIAVCSDEIAKRRRRFDLQVCLTFWRGILIQCESCTPPPVFSWFL